MNSPDADRPEHEPLADEKHDIGRAAEPQHLPDHAARRQDEEQQNDRCQIHTSPRRDPGSAGSMRRAATACKLKPAPSDTCYRLVMVNAFQANRVPDVEVEEHARNSTREG